MDVGGLAAGVVVEVVGELCHKELEGVVAEEVGSALGVGVVGGKLMEFFVEELAGEVAEEAVFVGVVGFEGVDEVDVGRLGVVGEATCHGADVDEVVGLEDEEFGVEIVTNETGTNDIDLCVFVEHTAEVGPVREVVVVAFGAFVVAYGDFFAVVVAVDAASEMDIVPRGDNGAHTVGEDAAADVFAVGGEEAVEIGRNGFGSDEGDELAEVFEVVEKVVFRVALGEFVVLCEACAGFVDVSANFVVGVVFFEEVVGFGERSGKVECDGGGLLVDEECEDLSEEGVCFGVCGQEGVAATDFVEDLLGCLGGIGVLHGGNFSGLGMGANR